MTLSFDELRARRKPREKQVLVPLDEDLLRRIDHLERELPYAQHLDSVENRPAKAPKMEAELAELRAEAQQSAETFTFRELPRPVFRQLIADNKSENPRMRWDEDRFAPALLEACCSSHDYTVDQWKTLWDEWAAWVTAPLFVTAIEVNEGDSQVPFGSGRSAETDG